MSRMSESIRSISVMIPSFKSSESSSGAMSDDGSVESRIDDGENRNAC